MIVDIAAGVISIRHKLHGPNYCTVSACASSNTAIINAFDTIRLGKATVMIAGGSEAAITEASVGGFNAAQALSKNNEDPKGASVRCDFCTTDYNVTQESLRQMLTRENAPT